MKAAAPIKSLSLGKLSAPMSSPVAGSTAPLGKVGCAGRGLSPPGVLGGCCDPLGVQRWPCRWALQPLGASRGCAWSTRKTWREREHGGNLFGVFSPKIGGLGHWVNAALLLSCPQKPAPALQGTKWERAQVPTASSLRQLPHDCKPSGSCNLPGRFLSCLALLSRVMRRW